MRRREFIKVLAGSTAVAWPLAARGQPPAMRVIGFLSSASPGPFAPYLAAFLAGLREAGYFEGSNVTIEYRWAEGQYERLPAMAADLVQTKVAVIVASGANPPVLAAKAATSTIPIVFTGPDDPVKNGLVASLSRPGGNVTGAALFTSELETKQIELLRTLVPTAAKIAVLFNPNNPNFSNQISGLDEVRRTSGAQLVILKGGAPAEIDAAFAAMAEQHTDALLVGADPYFNAVHEQITFLAARYKLPALYTFPDLVIAGGLRECPLLTHRRHQLGDLIGCDRQPGGRMRRREFIVFAGGVAVAWPLVARAQQPDKVARVGFLRQAGPDAKHFDAFRDGLREAGYSEGHNLLIEQRYAAGAYERLFGLATELISSNVDVIVVDGTAAAKACKDATATVPIVFTLSVDPVADGLAASFAHPGGNLTGLTMAAGYGLAGKRVELLKDMVAALSRVAVLSNPDNPPHVPYLRETERTATALGLEVRAFEVRSPPDLTGVFAAIADWRADGLATLTDGMLFSQRARVVELALKSKLPAVYPEAEFATAGGLASYGPSLPELFRRAANYVDKILKGAKPADLPIEQPAKFELVVNLKTAKSLGLPISRDFQLRADQLIE